jgi:hypothetical protein
LGFINKFRNSRNLNFESLGYVNPKLFLIVTKLKMLLVELSARTVYLYNILLLKTGTITFALRMFFGNNFK